ncbi:MAG: site-specific integrase [Solirubrobacterales bacterium]|nr:site-specific integrase [Solirubrobacterales bacterium]
MPRLQPETVMPQSWLVVAVARDGTLVYEAGWRHRRADGVLKTMKRRLGPAWLERDEVAGFRRRRGRPKPGFLDEPAAIVAKDRLVRTVEHELAERADAAERKANAPATFREVAAAYLVWLEDVRDAKPSTLREHRYLLVEPGTPYRRGKGTHIGTIMALLGDRAAGEITTREINELLARVARTGVSPRTVNKHRQLISAIFGFAGQEATFGLPKNPATASDRRAEPEPARLDFYSSEEVEALARSLETGLHRDPDAPAVSDAEAIARRAEDHQDGELVRVAAYAGLRRGELVALRWRDVDFVRRKIVVRRSVSASVDTKSTRSRRAREVPLPDQAAGALDRLSQRDFTSADDYVFVNRLGRRLDGSAVRRRVERARDAIRLRPMRFHDLRHTYGSLLVAGGVDLASVKAAMGHSRLATTERYLHARSATELADRFTQALRGADATAEDDCAGTSVGSAAATRAPVKP